MQQKKLLQKALNLVPRQINPKLWAFSQYFLGATLAQSLVEDPIRNAEQAIKALENALLIITCEDMPLQWAEINKILSGVYTLYLQGDRTENIEKAIRIGNKALKVFAQQSQPIDWAEAMMNLGNAYSYRIIEDRSENIELAIKAYQTALKILTPENTPLQWIQCMNNASATYFARIHGDRTENIEQAIELSKQALTVATQKNFLPISPQILFSLGNAYSVRIKGRKPENINQAIAAYQKFLELIPPKNLAYSALTIVNLANAYFEIKKYDYKNIETAIELYKKALTRISKDAMPIEWAEVINNLGLAYSERSQDEYPDTIEQAISAHYQALTIRTRTKMPFEWAKTTDGIAEAYTINKQGDRTKNIEQAITFYQDALEVFTPDSFPNDCRRVAYKLGRLYSEEKCWHEAVNFYKIASQAAENLYQSATLIDSRASEILVAADLPRRLAYTLAYTGNYSQAIETIEQGRARGLSESLDRDRTNLDQLQQQNSDLYDQYKDLTNQLHNLEAQQREHIISSDRHNITPAILRNEATRLRQQLAETIDQIRQQPGYETFLCLPTYEVVRQATTSEFPLTYLLTIPAGSLALIVTLDNIHPLWLDDFTEYQLVDLLNNTWFPTYQQSQSNHQGWLSTIDQTTQQIWNPLIEPLVQKLKDLGYDRTILIPTGYLGLLPLHAAWTEDPNTPTGRRYALDDIHFTYAPNAKSLTAAQTIVDRVQANTILAIDNPTQDPKLPNSEREVQAAIAHFPQHQVLRHEEATIASVREALQHCNILHLSCHGTANLTTPLTSGLLMSDGLLTLKNILDLKLAESATGSIRLAILSACETGLTGIESADEAIGLPTGLLQAGVAGVIASLWEVSDLSTRLLFVKFYKLWREEKLPPDRALRQAQIWLRDSTDSEKEDFFPDFVALNGNDRSSAHPYHWAAFSYTGV